MRFDDHIRRNGWPMTMIVVGRVVASLFLLVLHVDWATRGLPRGGLMGFGTTVFVVWSVVWLYVAFRDKPASLPALLGATAVVDGIALAALTASLAVQGTTLFGWYMVDATVISILMRKSKAGVYGAVLALSYVAGILGRGAIGSVTDLVLLLINMAAIVGVSVAAALVLGQEQEHRAEIEAQADDVTELNRKLERSVAELRAITEITELIHSTLDIETVGPTLLSILEKVINIPAASLYVIDKGKQETIFSTSSVGSAGVQRSYSGLELAGALRPAGGDGALSCIELADHNQMIVVFCADAGFVDALTPDDRVVLGAVASELVVAVENSRLYRLTKRLAITDELTDLFNYRYLQQRLDDELGRAERYGKRLSIMMLDLDDFKRVNDTHGHLVGDSVLADVGQLLKSTVREVDMVARYGGEEFTIILPETDASGAFIVAEKIRETISMHRFADAEGVRSIHLTTSIGLASYPVHAQDKESLLRVGDDALYQAKGTGKDRVRAPRLRIRRVPVETTMEKETAE